MCLLLVAIWISPLFVFLRHLIDRFTDSEHEKVLKLVADIAVEDVFKLMVWKSKWTFHSYMSILFLMFLHSQKCIFMVLIWNPNWLRLEAKGYRQENAIKSWPLVTWWNFGYRLFRIGSSDHEIYISSCSWWSRIHKKASDLAFHLGDSLHQI